MTYDVIMENVSFKYIGSEKLAIKDIDLRIEKGEIVLITGPAGAGKTTLCMTLNGLIPHFYAGKLEGKVFVRGKDTTLYSTSDLSTEVGFVFQDPSAQLFCPTVEDELAFGPENYGVPRSDINKRIAESLKAVRLEKYRDSSPQYLSGGEQQAVAIAAIMTIHPNIYVFDEPTSNLDPLGSEQVFHVLADLVRMETKTLIIVEHKIEELAAIVDRMIVMDGGQIVLDGRPREVLEHAEELEAIGVRPPQVTVLAKKLGLKYDRLPVTVEEMAECLRSHLSMTRKYEKTASFREKPLHMPERARALLIEVKDVWYIYPKKGTEALRDVNLNIYAEELIGIIGQNGAGKTTLVKHFIGLLKPTKGTVYVYGVDTKKTTPHQLATNVGFCFQNPDHQIFSDNVREEVGFGPKNLGLSEGEVNRRVVEALKRVNLEWAINEDPYSLSLGERRRITVASVLTMRPKILVIDEPTTGQDYKRGKEIMELAMELNQDGTTVVVISHNINLISNYAKRVIVMKDGNILDDGSTRDIFSRPEMLRQSYLRPPQITRLGQKLRPPRQDVLTVDEMYNFLVVT